MSYFYNIIILSFLLNYVKQYVLSLFTFHSTQHIIAPKAPAHQKLKQGGYPQACIDLALEYVKSFHYVDDYRYACTYINYRQDRMSRYQLKVKLYGKGIPGELIDRALEECYEGDEQEQIIRLLEK